MEYLSSFRLTSKKHFSILLLYCSNMVDLENNGTWHQFLFKQVLCKAFFDYIDDGMPITSLVFTLAWCMLEGSSNKVCCGTQTLSHPWPPYKLARSRSPCTRKSWRVSIPAAELSLPSHFSPLLLCHPREFSCARKTIVTKHTHCYIRFIEDRWILWTINFCNP